MPGPIAARAFIAPSLPIGNFSGGGAGGGGWIWRWPQRLDLEPKPAPIFAAPDGSEVFARGAVAPRVVVAQDVPLASQSRIDALLQRMMQSGVPVALMTIMRSPDSLYRTYEVEVRVWAGHDLNQAVRLAQGTGFLPLGAGGQHVRLLAPVDPTVAPVPDSIPAAMRALSARMIAEQQARAYEVKLDEMERQLLQYRERLAYMEQTLYQDRLAAAQQLAWSQSRLAAVESQLGQPRPPGWPMWLKAGIIVGVAALVALLLAASGSSTGRPKSRQRPRYGRRGSH